MDKPKPKNKFSIIQSEFIWIGIACYIVKIYLGSKDASDNFGTWLSIAKQLNISIMITMVILSGKTFYIFLMAFKKMPGNLEDAEEEVKKID